MRLFSQLSIASLVALASSTAIPLERRAEVPQVLDVKLVSAGNTLLKAVITNTGLQDLNLFNKGTFLDSGAVEKVSVSTNSESHQCFLSSKVVQRHPSKQQKKTINFSLLPFSASTFVSTTYFTFSLFLLVVALVVRPCLFALYEGRGEFVMDVTIFSL